MMIYRKNLSILVFTLLSIFTLVSVNAVAPTEEAIAKWKADGTFEGKIESWRSFKAAGGCAPFEHSSFNRKKIENARASGNAAVDTAKILVILVEFTDHRHDGSTHGQNSSVAATWQAFDSILFSDSSVGPVINPTGSMTDFYKEISYGQYYVLGGLTNWLTMPQTYAHYEGGNNCGPTNSEPCNGLNPSGPSGRNLAEDAVVAAHNAGIDFSDYDYDGDGQLDGLVIIHAGRGAETGVFGIWSHAWQLANPKNYDGVFIDNYTMNPEEDPTGISPIGVICHEFGHFLSLPDLYDIDYDPPGSDGLGRWSLMASGNYNGNGQLPAHMDAWCKSQIGFLSLINVTANMDSVALPTSQFTPTAYRLSNGLSGSEYWIVENRQKMGSDAGLPGEGLLLYHVDGALGGSNNYNGANWYRVALEQADGLDQLQFGVGNSGDAGDPYPGSTNNREFHEYTTPANETYSGFLPRINLWEISDSDSIMYVDLDIAWSRPYIVNDSIRFDDALGNGDGNLDPGETIRFYFTARNFMLPGYNATATLSTSNPDISFSANDVNFTSTFDAFYANNNSVPITFTVDIGAATIVDSFYLTITCDSTSGGVLGNAANYTAVFGFEQSVGTPRIIVVDDDRGATYQDSILMAFNRTKNATNYWDINTQGLPNINDLNTFPIVIWSTGDSAGNVIDAPRIALMKQYLDAGNSLMLATMSGVANMHTLDSAFLHNYFKTVYTGSGPNANFLYPVTGSEVGDGGRRYVCPPSGVWAHVRQAIAPVSGGEAFLAWNFGQSIFCAISSRGSYNTILVSAPIENIRETTNRDPIDTLLERAVLFFNGTPTDVGDGPNNLPLAFSLEQNFPNPFNPATSISYTIHSRGENPKAPNRATLVIYNLLGQKIKTLVDKVQSPGIYTAVWHGDNDAGEHVSSGVYFYRLILGDEFQTKKMVLMK